MISPGTKVTCPECEVQITEVKEAIHEFMPIRSSLFKVERSYGQRMNTSCPECGIPWLFLTPKNRILSVHTEHGWRV